MSLQITISNGRSWPRPCFFTTHSFHYIVTHIALACFVVKNPQRLPCVILLQTLYHIIKWILLMPCLGRRKYRENQSLFNYEKADKAMTNSINDSTLPPPLKCHLLKLTHSTQGFTTPGTQLVNPIPPAHPTQRQSLSLLGIDTRATNTTPAKIQKTDSLGLLFSQIADPDQETPAASTVTLSGTVTGSTALSQSNVIALSKIFSTPTSIPSL